MKKVLNFCEYTDECRDTIVGIVRKMGAEVVELSDGIFEVNSNDTEIMGYIDSLAQFDMFDVE